MSDTSNQVSVRPKGKKPRKAPAEDAPVRHNPRRRRSVQHDMSPKVIRGRDDMVYQLADDGPFGVGFLEAQGFVRVNPTPDGPAIGIGPNPSQKGTHEHHGQVLMQMTKADYAELTRYGGYGVEGQASFDEIDSRVYDSRRLDPSRGHAHGPTARVEFESNDERSIERSMAVPMDLEV